MQLKLDDPDRRIQYSIRAVPMDEALRLRASGIKMYDYTKLTAINTCPTWGVLRYALHKTDVPMTYSGRMLAAECGHACHEFFAALRFWHLTNSTDPNDDARLMQIDKYGIKGFGMDRWTSMLAIPQDSDRVNNAQLFALDALHTSGYYDDPSDRKRTMANMELSCMAYAQQYLQSNLPVAVRGDLIGIEIPFVLEVKATKYANTGHFNLAHKGEFIEDVESESIAYYCGRIDGVHEYGDGLAVAENKTAASLNAAWSTSFSISHQVTGYTIAGSCIFNEQINNAIVMGVQIPLPRDVFNGIKFEPLSRTESDRLRWCEWFFEGVATYERYIDSPTQAPRYSHSCNRFFSACQFIPFCSMTREEQVDALDQMRVDEWSPLDHLVEDEVVP